MWASLSSDAAVFPVDSSVHFWISIHVYTHIQVPENKMQTDNPKISIPMLSNKREFVVWRN